MNKKWLIFGLMMILGVSSICLGAQSTYQQQNQAKQEAPKNGQQQPLTTFQLVSQASQEMRKNVAWLTEGLLDLGKDKKLALSAAQKKKILPIFQSLIQQRIVLITQENNNNHGHDFGSQSGPPDVNDPKVQARMKRMQDATTFGNAQADAIDAILSREQVSFIDNIDFNAEKYGFIDFNKLFGGGGQRQGQRPSQATIDAIREKMHNGRALLIKLNNQVLAMLSH